MYDLIIRATALLEILAPADLWLVEFELFASSFHFLSTFTFIFYEEKEYEPTCLHHNEEIGTDRTI